MIVLDSTPLGLIVNRAGHRKADECQQWLTAHLAAGRRIIVPEIIDYELRRELLRLGKTSSIKFLESFILGDPYRLLRLDRRSLKLAAELWANARKRGTPTADPHALDIDVILAAQVLAMGLDETNVVVATSNVNHLAQFVAAEEWFRIL